jgi:hypothetical protein
VGHYLLGPDAPEAARRRAAQEAFRHARDDFEAFAASSHGGTDVVTVELTIRGSAMRRHSVYTRLPGPLSLLLVAARNCAPGDLVVLRQVTAKCGDIEHSARWPFGMVEAEAMTRPAGAPFAELGTSGVRDLRHAHRDLGRAGVVLLERERTDAVVRLPRVWFWRTANGRPSRGLRFRWLHTTVRLGWSPGRGARRTDTVLLHR